MLELRENESINKAIDERIIPVKDELERKIELVLDQVEELKFSTEEIIQKVENSIEEVEEKEKG